MLFFEQLQNARQVNVL